jgi:hypothetical protein
MKWQQRKQTFRELVGSAWSVAASYPSICSMKTSARPYNLWAETVQSIEGRVSYGLRSVLQGQIDERLKHLSFSVCAHVVNVCRCIHGVVLGRWSTNWHNRVSRFTEFRQAMSHTIDDGDDSWRETESIKCIFAYCGVTGVTRGWIYYVSRPSYRSYSWMAACVLSLDVKCGSCWIVRHNRFRFWSSHHYTQTQAAQRSRKCYFAGLCSGCSSVSLRVRPCHYGDSI